MSFSRWLLPFILTLSFLGTSSFCAKDEPEKQKAFRVSPPSAQKQERLQVERVGFNDGLAKARLENKPIFVEFYTEWCVYCQKFQRETIQDQNVVRMLSENFIYIRLDAENSNNQIKYRGKSMSNVDLTRSFGINGYPSLVFLDSKGQPITLVPGFVPAPEFSAILSYIHQECYQTKISFHDFVKKGNCS